MYQVVPQHLTPHRLITSTLQQTAFNRLGYTSQRTMSIAQKLYEGIALGSEGGVGLITYMRTDSPRLAGEAIGEMRGWLAAELRLQEPFPITIEGQTFPVIWSIIGAALFVAALSLISGRRRI